MRVMWSGRHLVASLVRRQYQLRYRQSFLGVTWAFLAPLATLGAAAIVFRGIVNVDTGGAPYALFALSALVPWTFFANSVSLAVPSVAIAQQMVPRLAFPRAALPLSMIGASLVDLGIATAIFVAFAYAMGPGLPATAAWLPLLMLIEIVFVIGIGLLGSALNVFARDIRLAVPLFVQLWLFLTPVMYPLPEKARGWFLLNPMAGLVESIRGSLVFGRTPELDVLGPALVGGVAAFLLGSWYFRTTEHRFADVI